MNRLINSAMMPVPGDYHLEQITQDEFVWHLQNMPFQSFIGYPDTANFLQRISGVEIPLSREQTTVRDGDMLLIVRLKYRVANPADKSKFTPQDSDFEFFKCYYYQP